jgi:DNA-binding transcriptional LysR family regulator
MIDLRLIDCFVQAARLESFSGAAKALGISPGAVSQNIRALEDRLQVRLFNRTTRQVKLTVEGSRFLQRCGPAVEALTHAADDLTSERDSFRGTLRIATTTAFGRSHIIPIAGLFQRMHPDLIIEMQFADSYTDLVGEEFDLAIRGGILPDSSYVSRLLLPITPIVCASPDYVERHGLPRSVSELSQHRLIAMRSNPSQQLFAWEFGGIGDLKVESVEISPCFIVNDPAALGVAAVNGVGIAQIGSNIARPLLRSGQLVMALKDRAIKSRGIYAVYPSKRYLAAKVRAFIDLMVEQLGEHSDA